MGTRSMHGLRKNGIDKTQYNQCDGDPEGVGQEIYSYVSKHTNEELNNLFDRISLVQEDLTVSQLTVEQKEKYKKFIKDYKCSQYIQEEDKVMDNLWMYSFLHDFQGNLDLFDKYPEIDIMVDGTNFIKNSLFCEWAYIINLDTEKLEIWEGFQKKPQPNNRYGTEENEGYYPCALIAEIDFDFIRANKELQLISLIEMPEEAVV